MEKMERSSVILSMKDMNKRIDCFVKKYARKHNMTEKQALTQERVQNVIAWIKLRG